MCKPYEDVRFDSSDVMQGMHEGRFYFLNMDRLDLKKINHWMVKQVYLNIECVCNGH